MRKKWFFLGCLTSLLIVIIFFVSIGFGIARYARRPQVKVQPYSFLNISLDGVIEEYIEIKDDFFSSKPQISVHEIVRKINTAAADDKINGILLQPRFIRVGWSSLNEIMNALDNFRNSGKKVIVYLEMAANKDYFLASVADEIYLNPSQSAGLILDGIGSNFLYFKDLFDSIGVDFNVFHAGDYKGAGENFTRNEMSDELKISIKNIYSGLYTEMVNRLAINRNLTQTEIKKIYEERDMLLISGKDALDMKLVDFLATRQNVLDKYNLNEKRLITLSNYKTSTPRVYGQKIAVVYMQGNISPAMGSLTQTNISSAKYRKIFEEISNDPTIKAVVLRIDSPGGSALESDIIYEMIERMKYFKPVVVSMANISASGGYYISAPADYIFADPYSITGSIGVVSMVPNFSDLSQSIGIKSFEIEHGKFVNAFNPWNPVKEQDKAAMQKMINGIYGEFKNRVSEARNLSDKEIESAAQGRIWDSRSALNLKLIDEVGGFNDAVRKAQQLADILNFELVYYPQQKTLLEYFISERFNLSVIYDFQMDSKLMDFFRRFQLGLLSNFQNDPIQKIMPIQIEN